MDNREYVTEEISCPQCGYPTAISRSVVTGETRICCQWCGYLGHKAMDGTKNERKGYGSLHRKNHTEVYGQPLSLLRRDEIYSEIKDEEDSSFYVYENGKLVPIKGKLPQTLEEYYEQVINEQEYYRSSSYASSTDINDLIPFED